MSEVVINCGFNRLKESATLAINNQVAGMREKGDEIAHFGFGQSPFPVHQILSAAVSKYSQQKSYLPGGGLLALREAISQHYRHHFDYSFSSQDVFIAPGSKESLFDLLFLLQGPLLLPTPSWVSYRPQAEMLSKPVVPIATCYENAYILEAKDLENACKNLHPSEQKILILNSPNNPTGLTYSQESFERLAQVCRAQNIVVISDEIYAGVQFDDKKHSSMVYSYPEKTIVTSGLSKYFSAGGYRLGFVMIPSALSGLKKALLALISETYSCVCSPLQYAALECYQRFDEIKPDLDKQNRIHQIAAQYLYQRFVACGLNVHKPKGAFYMLPDFLPFKEKLSQKGIENDVQLCEIILKEAKLALLPGSEFGMPKEALSVRVASVDYDGVKAMQLPLDDVFAQVMENLVAGCDRLQAFISEL